MERLDKYLCDSGIGSRSQIKGILKSGRVTVDGIVQRDGSRKIDPQTQAVCCDGEMLGGKRRVVLMLNKPQGFVTATEDKKERTVMELLPQAYAHLELKPVGRLDKATEGLLLFTNDGELLHRLISPNKEVPKVYYARHQGAAKYHQVRRMMASRNMTVDYLERVQEGPLTLGQLPRGQVRELTQEEISQLDGQID